MSIPLPEPKESGELTKDESGFILDTTLKPKDRKNPHIISFIDAFIRCKSIRQATDEAGIHYSLGYSWRHRADIANAIQKLIDKSTIKYGFDASEIVERVKEVVDFDPIMLVNADGTYKSNMNEIAPEARRCLRKLKVKNLYVKEKDLNGIDQQIIVGEIIEYEFYDKLKASDLVGKEKKLFTPTTKVVHSMTENMGAILLESSKRADEVKRLPDVVVPCEVIGE